MSLRSALLGASLLAAASSPDLGAPPIDTGPRSAIELYFKAQALGDGSYLRQALTPDAQIASADRGKLRRWTPGQRAAQFHGPAEDEYRRVRRIENLDVNGAAASAVVSLDYPTKLYRDHLSLLRIANEWRIVSDIFSVEQRDAGAAAVSQTLKARMRPFEPRRIIGNIYYVGSNLISSFLIATPAGHILIDTGPIQMLPQVEASIRQLGFRPEDVKLLVNSHAHFDHCGGFAAFRRLTRAPVIASKLDGELMMRGGKGDFYWGDELSYEPVTPDRRVADNEQLSLGGTTLTAHLTPGHTKGCTSWSMTAREGGKEYDVLFLCGLTVSPYKLTNNPRYPTIVQDAKDSLSKLRSLHVDVLLAAHGFWFDLAGKAARQKAGALNPFVDAGELGRHLAQMQQDLDQAVRAQEQQR